MNTRIFHLKPLSQETILTNKKYYIEFFDNRLEYHIYLIHKIPSKIIFIDDDSEEFEIEEWENEVLYETVIAYKEGINTFSVRWDSEAKYHLLTITLGIDDILEIGFKKRGEYKELLEYMIEWKNNKV